MRSLVRGLSILRALNERGPSTVVELSRATKVPRPSIYRCLETLCELGYAHRDASDRYDLTHLVRALSDGFNDEAWLGEVAAPAMNDLQQQIVWPVDLATFLNNAMYLRETTRRRSPLTIDRATVGLRLPMLLSATGRAYLAFCDDNERRVILDNLARSAIVEDRCARDPRWVSGILAETRRNGYGHRYGEMMPETGSIAIPIFLERRLLGCLNITFIASVMPPQEAAQRYLAPMKASAARIERAFATERASA
jgi:IclR family mhp operon transcriptional activator